MDWRKFITNIYDTRIQHAGCDAKPRFYSGVPAGELDRAESRLNAQFPASIRSLLLESDGVMEMIKFERQRCRRSGWLLWKAAEIVKVNLRWRAAAQRETQNRDFREFLFFADAGSDGIQFGFPVTRAGRCAPRVVAWVPIEGESRVLAPSLRDFVTGWLTGTIRV